MLLLMTLGTGIGTSDEDALSRLVRSCSFAIHSFRPAQVIYFCSDKSKDTIEPVHTALSEQRRLRHHFRLLRRGGAGEDLQGEARPHPP